MNLVSDHVSDVAFSLASMVRFICGPFTVCFSVDLVGALLYAGAHCGSLLWEGSYGLGALIDGTVMHSTQSVVSGL